jgi:pyruvate dehydrogenase E1 component
MMAYDPAYAYELAVIIEDGLRRMYADGEDIFYYITVLNENYAQPAMPEGAEDGILKGMYCVKPADGEPDIRLLGSGSILGEALKAAETLSSEYGLNPEVWSVTSYKELHRDAEDVGRWNRLNPDQEPRAPYIAECLAGEEIPVVAASDYVKALAESVTRWIPGPVDVLGTDGFGRSDGRPALRDFFEVDARHIAYTALASLGRAGRIKGDVVLKARDAMSIQPDRPNPLTV